MSNSPSAFKYRHLLAISAFVVFALVGVLVPQVRLLIEDLFTHEQTQLTLGILTAALVGWILAIFFHFLLVNPHSERQKRVASSLPRPVLRVIHSKAVTWPLEFLHRQATRFRSLGESPSGYAAIAIMIVLGALVAYLMPVRLAPGTWIDSTWPLAGGFFRMLGIFTVATAVWLFFGLRYGTSTVLGSEKNAAAGGDDERRQRVWRRSGEVLSALLWLMIVLELIWIAAEHRIFGTTLSVYSVWAFFAVAAAACIIASLIDFLDHNTTFWWRASSACLVALILSLPGHVDLQQQITPRIQETPAGVTRVAGLAVTREGSAGTLSSDLWLEASSKRLAEEPGGPVIIVAASGGGARAALAAALSLEEIQAVLRTGERPACIWLCSGVSGGGIALAAHFFPSPDQISTQDAVTADFLAPVYRGFLVPFQSRGESLTDFWDRQFRWDHVDQLSVGVERPLLVFGVSDIDLGRRVMIGFPRLPTNWYSRWTLDGERWITSDTNYEPYSLSALSVSGKPMNASLTQAVRMSSSFPFGFEPTRLEIDHPATDQPESVDVHFLDGGMVDNTGLDSIVAILRKLDGSEDQQASETIQMLRDRGVFLIEIDAGAGPGETAGSGPFHRLTQPIAGYNRGVFSAAVRSRDENVQAIRSLIGKKNFVYEPIQPVPAAEDVSEIMTTLALPQRDIQRLTNAFKKNRGLIRSALLERYNTLARSRLDNATGAGE